MLRRQWIDVAMALLLLGIVLWLARSLLFTGVYPWGTDILGHLYKVWYLGEHWQHYGGLAQWTPHWYNGTPITQYYPPLVYYLMLPLQLILDNTAVVYKVFVAAFVFGAAYLTYFLFKGRLGRPAAAFAGLCYVLAPYNMRTIFPEGHLPRALVILLMPVALYLLLKLVEEGRRRTFLLLAITTGAMVLAHQLEALMFLICFVPPVVLYYLIYKRTDLRRPAMGVIAMFLGVGLVAWWLIPASIGADLPSVPNFGLIPEKRFLYSVDWSIFNWGLRSINLEAVYLGPSLVVLAALGAYVRRDRLSFILGIAGGIGLFMAFGVHNPFFDYIPLNDRLFAERFLNVTILAWTILGARFFGWIWIHRRAALRILTVLAVVLIVVTDTSPYWSLVRSADQSELTTFANELADESGDGRLVDQVGTSSSIFLPSVVGGINQTYGWGVEGTPHLANIIAINESLRMDRLDFVLRTYALWNAGSVLVGEDSEQLLSRLDEAGFQQKKRLGSAVLLTWDRPASYFMVQDRNVLVIGRGATHAAMLFPWVAQGTSWYVDDYDLEYLSQFDGILLYDYRHHNRKKAEQLLRQLIDDGRTVIVDFTGKEYRRLFDVAGWPVETQGDYNLVEGDEAELLDGLDLDADLFSHQDRPWEYIHFFWLDAVLLSLEEDGTALPVVGYKNVGSGRVYFMGCNLLESAYHSQDRNAQRIAERLLDLAQPNKAIVPETFDVISQNWEDEALEFEYDSSQHTPVIISMTYSPHWKPRLDGHPIKLHEYENLCLLFLPPGRHTVEFVYSWTWIQLVGFGVSVLSLVGLVASRRSRFVKYFA